MNQLISEAERRRRQAFLWMMGSLVVFTVVLGAWLFLHPSSVSYLTPEEKQSLKNTQARLADIEARLKKLEEKKP
jgi:hypothetical protein